MHLYYIFSIQKLSGLFLKLVYQPTETLEAWCWFWFWHTLGFWQVIFSCNWDEGEG